MKTCPRCQQRYAVQLYDVDFVHQCSSAAGAGSALYTEDIFLIGDWADATGSGTSQFGTNTFMQGMGADNWGTESWIDGERVKSNHTPQGRNSEVFRTRKHSEYIELKEEK